MADRWHLLKNLTEMLQRALREHWSEIRTSATLKEQPPQALIFPRARDDMEKKRLSREKRLATYHRVQYLKHKGLSQLHIARLLGLSRGTVRNFYTATVFPERKVSRRSSQLDPYIPYLRQRMSDTRITARQLWQEILEQGYTGSMRQVSKWCTGYRKQATAEDRSSIEELPSRDTCLYLLTSQQERLTKEENYLLNVVLTNPILSRLYELAQTFTSMSVNGMIRSSITGSISVKLLESKLVSDLQTL